MASALCDSAQNFNSTDQYSHWRDIYIKLQCPGPSCKYSEDTAGRIPLGRNITGSVQTHLLKCLVGMVKREQKLHFHTHDDVPYEVAGSFMQRSNDVLSEKKG